MTSYGRIVSFFVMFSISFVWSGAGSLRALASCLAFSGITFFVGLLAWGGEGSTVCWDGIEMVLAQHNG